MCLMYVLCEFMIGMYVFKYVWHVCVYVCNVCTVYLLCMVCALCVLCMLCTHVMYDLYDCYVRMYVSYAFMCVGYVCMYDMV